MPQVNVKKERNFNNHEVLEQYDRLQYQNRFEENRCLHKQDKFDESRNQNEQVFNRGFFDQRANPQNPTILHLKQQSLICSR